MLPGASPLLQKIIAVYKGYLHDQIEDATPEEIKDFEMEKALRKVVGYSPEEIADEIEESSRIRDLAFGNLSSTKIELVNGLVALMGALEKRYHQLLPREVLGPQMVFLTYLLANQTKNINDIPFREEEQLRDKLANIVKPEDFPQEVIELAIGITEVNESFRDLDHFWKNHWPSP